VQKLNDRMYRNTSPYPSNLARLPVGNGTLDKTPSFGMSGCTNYRSHQKIIFPCILRLGDPSCWVNPTGN